MNYPLNIVIAGDYRGCVLSFMDGLWIVSKSHSIIKGTTTTKIIQLNSNTVESYKFIVEAPYKIIQLNYTNGGKSLVEVDNPTCVGLLVAIF